MDYATQRSVILKKLLLFTILLVGGGKLFAQYPTSDSYIGFQFGAGLSTNFITNPSLNGYSVKYKLSFGGGLYYNIPLGEKFSIQPELLYSQMGSMLASTQDQNPNANLELDYVSMPFLFKFSPIKNLGIFAGPQINFITVGKIDYESGKDEDVLSQFTNFDPTATLGAEYWITRNIGIYARGTMGFIDINEKKPGPWFNEQTLTSDITNLSFQAGITIGFPSGQNNAEESPIKITDTDGDSIPDKVDKCPTVIGTSDNLGCPQMILYYNNTDAILDSTDMSNLDKVAAFLYDNPKLNIIIEAHTSTAGDSVSNQELSQKRADASLDYLATKGISQKRMKAIGYGEQYPIGIDDTELERSWSKRVLIRVARD